jgi:hypothetical protein
VAHRFIEESGAPEIVPAIEQELLQIDPLLEPGTDDPWEKMPKAFIEKLMDVLQSRSQYPLFDQETGSLIRAGSEDGFFVLGEGTVSRGKQISLATGLLERLPSFPAASLDEVLSIRDDLQKPLVRFRSALVGFSDEIEGSSYDDEFEERLRDIYVREVEPALNEIREAVKENRHLRRLQEAVLDDGRTLMTGALGIGGGWFSRYSWTDSGRRDGARSASARDGQAETRDGRDRAPPSLSVASNRETSREIGADSPVFDGGRDNWPCRHLPTGETIAGDPPEPDGVLVLVRLACFQWPYDLGQLMPFSALIS